MKKRDVYEKSLPKSLHKENISWYKIILSFEANFDKEQHCQYEWSEKIECKSFQPFKKKRLLQQSNKGKTNQLTQLQQNQELPVSPKIPAAQPAINETKIRLK